MAAGWKLTKLAAAPLVFAMPLEENLPEICTFGVNLDEARAMAEDAIRCFLESALKHGESIPRDEDPTTERLAVSL